MDKLMSSLDSILYEEIRSYASSAYKGKLYFSVSEDETFYSVTFVPDVDYPTKVDTDIVVAARILDKLIFG